MHVDVMSLVVAGLAGINAYLLYRKSREPRERARRGFARSKRTAIGKIKDGQWVKVTGTVGAIGPTMTSPISRRECIGFWSEVDSVDQNSVVTTKDGRCGAFSVADDTGQVIVEGPFFLTMKIEQEELAAPAAPVQLLERISLKMEGAGRVREALLQPGDRVSVFGLVFLEPDPAVPSAGFRSPQLVRHMRGLDRVPIILGPAEEKSRSEKSAGR